MAEGLTTELNQKKDAIAEKEKTIDDLNTQIAALIESNMSGAQSITSMNLNLKPDTWTEAPAYEWPANNLDIATLIGLQDARVDWIETKSSAKVGEAGDKTIGVKLKLKGMADPIFFGKAGLSMTKAVFNEEQVIAKVTASAHTKYINGNVARQFRFYDSKGNQPENWIDSTGKCLPSINSVFSPGVGEDWDGKTVTIPEGYQICGFRVWTNAANEITWMDYKIWKPLKK